VQNRAEFGFFFFFLFCRIGTLLIVEELKIVEGIVELEFTGEFRMEKLKMSNGTYFGNIYNLLKSMLIQSYCSRNYIVLYKFIYTTVKTLEIANTAV
jgi:hypothetical protein